MNLLHCTPVQESHQRPRFAWPDFPVALKEATGARVDNVLFAGLGSAGQAWFSLDTARDTGAPASWRRRADFPFAARSGAAAAAAGDMIYVFGGCGRPAPGQSLQQFDSIACYDPGCDSWTELPARLPVGMLGACAAAIGSSIYLFGGYDKPQFDRFFQEYEAAAEERRPGLQHAFMARSVDDFAWNDRVWEFDTVRQAWHDRGPTGHAPTCGTGIIVNGRALTLACGEIKPGLRTPKTSQVSIHASRLDWQAMDALPAGEQPQEGIASAFAGKCVRVKILAGGTHFPGARRAYESGELYAHKGLRKLWRDEIYISRRDVWELAGHLPQGRASGLSFEVEQGLLLVGGDTQDGTPCLETWLLSYNESTGITISSNKLI
ncbi:YjhT family mutarotase [Massilia oculi]|uniref:YjhT family mutarotase n=1 Tax=Massilia hydrophila TaxID=3044279 RepID=A0ABS7Y6B6_9BURK|nr:YjhT family mutarotase [Massilia oculi]